MNRRQRKKHRLGEFTQYAFPVRFRIPPEQAGPVDWTFTDTFMAWLEAHGFGFGGGCGAQWDGFVAREPGSATDADRELVRAWLAGRPEVSDVEIGPLEDAWH